MRVILQDCFQFAHFLQLRVFSRLGGWHLFVFHFLLGLFHVSLFHVNTTSEIPAVITPYASILPPISQYLHVFQFHRVIDLGCVVRCRIDFTIRTWKVVRSYLRLDQIYLRSIGHDILQLLRHKWGRAYRNSMPRRTALQVPPCCGCPRTTDTVPWSMDLHPCRRARMTSGSWREFRAY